MPQVPIEVQPPLDLVGTAGADTIYATKATLLAEESLYSSRDFFIHSLGGNDTIVRDRTGNYIGGDGFFGHAQIDGGAGMDVISYAGADTAITARLDWSVQLLGDYSIGPGEWGFIRGPLTTVQGEFGWLRGYDFVKNVENLVGSAFGDEIWGGGEANRFWGHDGDDIIHGGGGADRLYGMVGDDNLYGGDGADLIEGGDGVDFLSGGAKNDTLYGGDGQDDVYGDDGNDVLYGGDGGDVMLGGKGNDAIHAGEGSNDVYGEQGNDTIHVEGFGSNEISGGSGADKVVYTQHVVVNLAAEIAWRGQNGIEGTDDLVSIENVTTGQQADVVIASDAANVISLGDGGDFAMGLGDDDKLYGHGGNDTLAGGDGEDDIFGGNNADRLYGDAGDDLMVGGKGGDRIAGGEGADAIFLGNIGPGSDAERDVLVWDVGDLGVDVVHGFSLSHDRFDFEPGFLAAGAKADNLAVFDLGADARLFANVAGHGWEWVALLKNVDAAALSDAVENGSILDVEVGAVGGGAPGGFHDIDPLSFGPADFQFGTAFLL